VLRNTVFARTFDVDLAREVGNVVDVAIDCAKQLHGGNMSELVAEMGRQALRLAALERMLARRGGSKPTDESRLEIEASSMKVGVMRSGTR
jgi:hypothetical protein